MSNKKWNKKEAAYLIDNYGKMSLEELSANLGRSVMAVRLYALRHRLDDKHQVVKRKPTEEAAGISFPSSRRLSSEQVLLPGDRN